MSNKKTFYITTPIYYPSGRLHIGHAYTTVAADTMARYKRLQGFDVMYLTGTDEHGQKIQKKAEAAGQEPLIFLEKMVMDIKNLWQMLDISYDDFIRTTETRHKKIVQKIFQRLQDQGDIYLDDYEGWYCVDCEAFFSERQVTDGKCLDCRRDINKIKEKSYFFRMSKYADRLIAYYNSHKEFIQPESRKNEMLQNFLKPGLEDLSVSRTTFSWGIPVLNDPEHVMYVWIDALANYISALGYSDDEEKFKKYWPADVHIVGKDIVRFHTIYWPILLMALDLPLPKKVFAHGFFMIQGEKMSKSRGNIIDPLQLIDRYSSDAIRYYLLREVPFGVDGVFTPESFLERTNADLANDLGNLFYRTLTMVEKYFSGQVSLQKDYSTSLDNDFRQLAIKTVNQVESAMEKMQFSIALTNIWELIRAGNRYIEATMPWRLAKEEDKRPILENTMYHLLEALRFVGVMLQPFLTQAPNKIWLQLGVDQSDQVWKSLQKFGVKRQFNVIKKDPLFPRLMIEDELKVINEMIK